MYFKQQFGRDYDVYMTKADLTYTKMTTGELLPLGFCPEQLDEERISHSA